MSKGAELFANELSELGYKASVSENWVEFDYCVEGGTYSGKNVRMAISVPSNFPITPPGGIDFKPRLRPLNPSAQHPLRSHEGRRFADGEYWSRPHQSWNKEKNKNTAAYMAWVRNLWFTT